MGQAFILQDIWDTWLLPTIWQQTPHHSYKQKCPTGVAPVLLSPTGTHLASHYWLLRNEHLQEKEMATHSSILAWKNPWTEETGGLKSMGLHDWACVHEGGGRWVGSNKLVELKKKKRKKKRASSTLFIIIHACSPKWFPIIPSSLRCLDQFTFIGCEIYHFFTNMQFSPLKLLFS